MLLLAHGRRLWPDSSKSQQHGYISAFMCARSVAVFAGVFGAE